MLLKQIFKSLAGVQKRVAFENAHRANDRYFFRNVLCTPDGVPVPDSERPFDFAKKPHVYRIERVLRDRPKKAGEV